MGGAMSDEMLSAAKAFMRREGASRPTR